MLGSMGRAQTVFVFFQGLEGERLERERLEKGFEGTCFSCWLKLRIL
jgi:hypothetical protein